MVSIKSGLKRNQGLNSRLLRAERTLFTVLVKASPVLATKYQYRRVMKRKLNLKNPGNLNEKIQWLKLYWRHPLVVRCADKYEVRGFIKERNCEEILNPLFGVYSSPREIDWGALPDKFVLKTTNSCGTNIICTDKGKLDKEEVFRKLNQWLKTDYGLQYGEIHYSKMTPRIICEQYIETKDGVLPNDYKIYCFNGVPKFFAAIIERDTGSPRWYHFDLDWNLLDFDKKKNFSETAGIPDKPESMAQMIETSRKLSEGFPFVRIDYYNGKKQAVFGEMTFTPVGGMATYYKEEVVEMLGDWIELPEKIL